MHSTLLRIGRLTVSVLLGLVLASPPAMAQIDIPDELPVNPEFPVKEGFDVERAFLGSRPIFTPLRNPEFELLRGALRRGEIAEDTPILVFEAGGRKLALITSQMSYHHVAQGEMAGEPWMVTF